MQGNKSFGQTLKASVLGGELFAFYCSVESAIKGAVTTNEMAQLRQARSRIQARSLLCTPSWRRPALLCQTFLLSHFIAHAENEVIVCEVSVTTAKLLLRSAACLSSVAWLVLAMRLFCSYRAWPREWKSLVTSKALSSSAPRQLHAHRSQRSTCCTVAKHLGPGQRFACQEGVRRMRLSGQVEKMKL